MTHELKSLYPEIAPYDSGVLNVGDGHEMYWEQCGNPNGAPIVFLHGGPGSGLAPWCHQLFNPEKYRVILFDQRGAGKSTPHASLENNTTPHLIADIEKLRVHLNVESWHVFGGSWGATLALAYADSHAARVNGLVVYGIFLARDRELAYLYHDGGAASQMFPEMFKAYLSLLPEDKQHAPLQGYQELFQSDDENVRHRAVEMWTRLEKQVSCVVVSDEEVNAELSDPEYILAHSLLENHYFLNNGFIDGDALLKTLPSKLAGKSVHIVHGRYDLVCPLETALTLHKALPESHLYVIEGAGHSAKEPATRVQLIELLDNLPC